MLGGQAQSIGIEFHVPVDMAVVPYKADEPVCYLVISGNSAVTSLDVMDVCPETIIIGGCQRK